MPTSDANRIALLLDNLGISANKLSKLLELPSPQIFYDIKAGRCGISKELAKKIKEKFVNINISWLLTGIGDIYSGMPMAGNDNTEIVSEFPTSSLPPISDISGVYTSNSDYYAVPVMGIYYMEMPGGRCVRGEDSISNLPRAYFLEGRDGDIAVPQLDNSMAPDIPAGSIVLVRPVDLWNDFLGYGNDYMIVLKDKRRMVKCIQKNPDNPDDFFLLHSYNKDIADEKLPKSLISEVWKVISILTPKGW